MKELVRQRALELGFDDCRFTTAEPPATAPQFRHWLDAGQHGEMGYLERNATRRVNPQLVLPGARSVIMLAVSYERVQSPESRARPTTRIQGSSHATPVSPITTTSWPHA